MRSLRLKRLFDVVASAAGLLLLAPLLLAIAVWIRLDSPGLVFFRQERVGLRGQPFRIFKFRSMRPDNAGPQVTVGADKRITRSGRFIRAYKLDELPQLLNVLFGEMSLVGPRPPLPREVDQYEPDALRRLRVRPGMTGLWQVSGRSDLSWEESLRLDLHYVDNWSPTGDLHIMLRTVSAVVNGPGAY